MKKYFYLLLALTFAFTISKAQIPNAGFETWTNMGTYNNPDSWDCLNSMTSGMSVYTCQKGTPGNPGTSYIKLTSKTVTGMGVMPGIAVCGTLDQSTMQPLSGFAFNQRPASLTGKWQHMIFGNSQGFIDVQLTYWDAGLQMSMPVATAHQTLSGMAMSWATFTIPLTYVSNNTPDSCIIILSASGSNPANNDYLWVDNLSFTGTVAGIKTNDFSSTISVFPIPAVNDITVNLSSLKEKYVTLQISDMQGKLVTQLNKIEVSAKTSIDISALQKGNYMLTVIATEGTGTINFIKQ